MMREKFIEYIKKYKIIFSVIVILILAFSIFYHIMASKTSEKLDTCHYYIFSLHLGYLEKEEMMEFYYKAKEEIQMCTKNSIFLSKNEKEKANIFTEYIERFPIEEICTKYDECDKLESLLTEYKLCIDNLVSYDGTIVNKSNYDELYSALQKSIEARDECAYALAKILKCDAKYFCFNDCGGDVMSWFQYDLQQGELNMPSTIKLVYDMADLELYFNTLPESSNSMTLTSIREACINSQIDIYADKLDYQFYKSVIYDVLNDLILELSLDQIMTGDLALDTDFIRYEFYE